MSKHNFSIPETVQVENSSKGQEYTDHLLADDSGKARINLNGWEQQVLEEEEQQSDYVCWLRNPPRKSWSLCIPYEKDGETKPAYPDFIVVREESLDDYVVDILEPHDPTRIDNLGKAKGFAEYARQNPGIGRFQLIRLAKYAAVMYKQKMSADYKLILKYIEQLRMSDGRLWEAITARYFQCFCLPDLQSDR